MEAMGTLSGGALVVKKYHASATLPNAGVPIIGSDESDIGETIIMAAAGTAQTKGAIGLSLDVTGTVGAVVTDTNDILVSVATNPDLMVRAKMTGGATEDTALTIVTEDGTGSATGIIVNGYTSLKGETVWGYDGGNKGEHRKFDDTSGGVGISFPNAIVGGDRFLTCAGGRCMTLASAEPFPDLSTLSTQIDADTTPDADADNLIIIDLLFGTEDNDGANNSFYIVTFNQHAFGSTGLTA